MPDELWGTFSVRDHLRRRAFVADVLLYDRLVIPYPPDEEQRREWRSEGWAPGRLERKLEILAKADLVRPAPWSEWKRDLFRSAWAQLLRSPRRAATCVGAGGCNPTAR
jgi:hypothetical protein